MSRRTGLAVVVTALVAIVWARSPSGQVQSVPGPGSGIVTVTGRVAIDDVVRVTPATNDWRVVVANMPDVRVANTPAVTLAPLPFIRVGARYEITWGPNERESIRVAQAGNGGWVRAESDSRTRWINLSIARAVEELR
jgi:hypothetical protein